MTEIVTAGIAGKSGVFERISSKVSVIGMLSPQVAEGLFALRDGFDRD